ncbi:MAG: Proline dehydrogenase [Candidatus Azambacteria bacterium GW2011_GWC1_46_13]|uniref:Proline dehydrogenase n=1 Tax=Candidatus Azambacteria bacterium GW2011_GWC1_46_13 TaxID=1618619 RepID=A0A0G1NNI6_9BACT|nr:MAG: Proline dehydrogenase [Candidatus Azambacteria bacterium GW2011_GWC1_46_13]
MVRLSGFHWLILPAALLISALFIPFLFKHRFIAGKTIGSALRRARKCEKSGIAASIDHLGEDIKSVEQVAVEIEEYLNLIDKIKKNGLKANIAVKPTSLGLALPAANRPAGKMIFAVAIEIITQKAKRENMSVWLDMEDSRFTHDTVDIAIWLNELGCRNIGVAIQAYLKRSKADIEPLCRRKIPIRLCKGIYREKPEIAFQKDGEIRKNFLELAQFILENKSPIAVATHDPLIVQEIVSLARKNGDIFRLIEFQMLLGKRTWLLRKLAAEGHQTRIYIPYGKRWLRYAFRRLKEGKLLKLLFS